MNIYRCRICGETYLGNEAPSQCPYCGAHRELLVDTIDYPEDINEVHLTEIERDDIMKSIDLEHSNARFYFGMGTHKADNPKLASAYKRLAKIELEHAELFCKLAGVPLPSDIQDPADVTADWCSNIEESINREQQASRFYAKVSSRATNERIKEVFAAVRDIEDDHINLDGVAQGIADC